MELPARQRSFYTKSPLVEVVCQLRFPTVLEIAEGLPAEFQRRIADDYPLLEVRELFHISGFPLEAPPSPIKSLAFDFYTEDRSSKATLTSSFLAITTNSYVRWEDFREQMSRLLGALVDIYRVKYFTRSGLRYQNIIRPDKLEIGTALPSDLLSDALIGPVIEFGSKLESHESVTEFQRSGGKNVCLRFAITNETEPESVAYVVDCDVYSQELFKADANALLQLLDSFNGEASHIFRWCIKQPLHEALGPEPC